jgi:hypothetical protein
MLALPFAVFGTLPFVSATHTVVQSMKAQSWQEVPALIQDATLDVNTGRKGDSTYQTRATYTYEFNGESFTGSTVSFNSGSDNIGSFHKDIYRQLSRFRGGPDLFRCYVNPHDPRESVLYRDARAGHVMFVSLFGLVFGGIGYGFLAGALRVRSRNKQEAALRQRHPDAPWLHKPEWCEKKIVSGAKDSLFVTTIVAVVCTVFSAPVLALLPAEVRKGEKLTALFALLFLLIALTALACFVYAFLRWRRFGRTTLSLAAVPIVPGECLRGTITSPITIDRAGTVTIKLECQKTTTSQSGKKQSVQFESAWHREDVASIQREAGGSSVIPFAIDIPADLPSTGRVDSTTTVTWTLTAKAEIRGVDFWASFDVPVFATDTSTN